MDDLEQMTWQAAAALMVRRAEQSALALKDGEFPHWANADTGKWTTTPDGDWTGGAFPGILWLGYRLTGEHRIRDLAHVWGLRLRPRVHRQTAFKGFGFFCGAVLGSILAKDDELGQMAEEAAGSLVAQFDPALGLIPLGPEAEEAGETGSAFSSIDSLQASPLLYWAADRTGDPRFRRCADRHTERVFQIHCRPDGSIIQSSELEAATGRVTRHFTHKGFSDTSIWGRAQGWGMLYTAMAFVRTRQPQWLTHAMRAADWWLAHLPADGIAYWDFDDPAIPDAPRDTAATTIASAALLRLAQYAPTANDRTRYQQAAEHSVRALVRDYLTREGGSRPAGMLVGGCFNNRADSRSHDRVTNAELIFGSYFLVECLLLLGGSLKVEEL